MATTMPPRAVPSSLVSTRPVTPTAAWNSRACASAFCPWLASSTSSTSSGAAGSTRVSTRRTFLSSSIRCVWLCRRPAVSAISTSMPCACAARSASNTTAPGSAPAACCTIVGAAAFGPDVELFGGGGAEGVAGRQHDLAAFARQAQRQLADGGGLARAVHAHHHDHERPARRGRWPAAWRRARGWRAAPRAVRSAARRHRPVRAAPAACADVRGSPAWRRCRRPRRSAAPPVHRAVRHRSCGHGTGRRSRL